MICTIIGAVYDCRTLQSWDGLRLGLFAVDDCVEIEGLLLLGRAARAKNAFVDRSARALIVVGNAMRRLHFDLNRIFGRRRGMRPSTEVLAFSQSLP